MWPGFDSETATKKREVRNLLSLLIQIYERLLFRFNLPHSSIK